MAKTGRPPQYKKRYCQMLINFFGIEPFSEQKVNHYDESGKKNKNGQPVVAWIETKKAANRTPTLQRFAKKIKVGISTVYDWLNENHDSFHKEFSDAFACARELRKNFLIENALHRTIDSSSFKFTAENLTDMREKQEHEFSGAVSLLPPNIE